MLMNFCDSAFTIGESVISKSMRYLKQIKQRNTSQVYDSNNVCVCEVTKPSNFLQYEFRGPGIEYDHLNRQRQSTQQSEHTDEVVAMHAQGKSLREIGTHLGISHQRVSRIIKAAESTN
jgi:DNA-binding NarL/FixJ family response regulator